MADQVRRREKVKKRDLQLWQDTWLARAADPLGALDKLQPVSRRLPASHIPRLHHSVFTNEGPSGS